MRKVATALIWMCQPSHPNCIVHILGEEDKKSNPFRPIYLRVSGASFYSSKWPARE